MRASPRRKASVLCAIALLGALTACSPPEPPPKTTAPPTAAAPVFATDEEALAAATEAYAAYSQTSDVIFNEGGVESERIAAFTSVDYARTITTEFDDIQAEGLRSTGKNTFYGVTVQQVDEAAPGGVGVVVVYLCSDVSATDVVDATGTSIITESRPPKTPFAVTFDWKDQDRSALVVASQAVWKGDGVC